MLQFSKVQSKTGGESTPSNELSGAELLHIFVSFLQRQYPVILLFILLTTALGAGYLFFARPSFTATAQLIIDAHKIQALQQQQPLLPIDTAQVESQVGVLKSENIASAVIKKFNLTKDPEFTHTEAGLLGRIFGLEGTDQTPPSEFELFRRAMRVFKERLSVARVGQSYIIEIAFRSYNPEHASQIANALADAYITDQLEAKYKATRQAGGWLQDRIKELRKQVTESEHAAVQFKTDHNIVSTGGNNRPLLNQQEVTELSSQLTIARANTGDARARLDRINAVLKTDSSDGSLPDASFGATVTDMVKNEIVTKLWSQYLDLTALEKNWAAKYGSDHLAVVNLRNRKRELRNSIFEELKRLGETFKSDYEIAKQREAGLQKELAAAVAKSQTTDVNTIALSELESTAQTYKSIYDNYLRRYMEAVQEESFPVSDARVISAATKPLRQSSPDSFRVFALAGLAGIALGFAAGMLRNLSDRVFRTSQQVEGILNVNCIAVAPLTGPVKRASRRSLAASHSFLHSLLSGSPDAEQSGESSSETSASDDDGRRIVKNSSDEDSGAAAVVSESNVDKLPPRKRVIARGGMLSSVVDAPLSRFSEAIRSIKLANDLCGTFKSNRIVGCTSSLPNEGKSTIAFSLAQLMAQVGGRTILVDCDLRNPTLSRALTRRTKIGLIDVLAEKIELKDAIWTDPLTKMVFLPALTKFRFVNTNEILSSVPMKKLFENLRESYDYVVVDLPPLAPIVDTRAAAPIVDSFVFVIEWGRTKIDVVEHALGQAQEVYDSLLGVVLNKVDMKTFGRYAGYKSGYYYNKGYARYGYTE